MANVPVTTGERPLARTTEEIIREAKRIEEDLRHSSGGHFVAAQYWGYFHLWLGIPNVITAALAGASFLTKIDSSGVTSGLLSLIVLVLSSLMTFLNPNDKASAHLTAGNQYDALMNRVRIFHSIDCWKEESEEVLTQRLVDYSEQKSKLNQNCPQVPRWAYLISRKRIEAGERAHQVDP